MSESRLKSDDLDSEDVNMFKQAYLGGNTNAGTGSDDNDEDEKAAAAVHNLAESLEERDPNDNDDEEQEVVEEGKLPRKKAARRKSVVQNPAEPRTLTAAQRKKLEKKAELLEANSSSFIQGVFQDMNKGFEAVRIVFPNPNVKTFPHELPDRPQTIMQLATGSQRLSKSHRRDFPKHRYNYLGYAEIDNGLRKYYRLGYSCAPIGSSHKTLSKMEYFVPLGFRHQSQFHTPDVIPSDHYHDTQNDVELISVDVPDKPGETYLTPNYDATYIAWMATRSTANSKGGKGSDDDDNNDVAADVVAVPVEKPKSKAAPASRKRKRNDTKKNEADLVTLSPISNNSAKEADLLCAEQMHRKRWLLSQTVLDKDLATFSVAEDGTIHLPSIIRSSHRSYGDLKAVLTVQMKPLQSEECDGINAFPYDFNVAIHDAMDLVVLFGNDDVDIPPTLETETMLKLFLINGNPVRFLLEFFPRYVHKINRQASEHTIASLVQDCKKNEVAMLEKERGIALFEMAANLKEVLDEYDGDLAETCVVLDAFSTLLRRLGKISEVTLPLRSNIILTCALSHRRILPGEKFWLIQGIQAPSLDTNTPELVVAVSQYLDTTKFILRSSPEVIARHAKFAARLALEQQHAIVEKEVVAAAAVSTPTVKKPRKKKQKVHLFFLTNMYILCVTNSLFLL